MQLVTVLPASLRPCDVRYLWNSLQETIITVSQNRAVVAEYCTQASNCHCNACIGEEVPAWAKQDLGTRTTIDPTPVVELMHNLLCGVSRCSQAERLGRRRRRRPLWWRQPLWRRRWWWWCEQFLLCTANFQGPINRGHGAQYLNCPPAARAEGPTILSIRLYNNLPSRQTAST